MSKMYALHGFLGRPKDWEITPKFYAPDLFQSGSLGLWEWARNFNAQVARESEAPRVLMGYSLGGRLALHALIDQPSLWSAAVIISAHPGLSSEEEKAARFERDKGWAKRFESDPWDPLMNDWNAQDLFGSSSPCFLRQEKDYSRAALVQALLNWSLGKQDHLLPQLAKLTLPLLYIAGEQDNRYAKQAAQCAAVNSDAQLWIAPEAGHRVPWQQPDSFQNQLDTFLKGNNL